MAHRDFNEAESDGREARSRSGRGEVFTAVVLARIGEERLSLGLQGARACARGRKRWLRSWRSCWRARVAWKGSRRGGFCRRSKLVGVERKGEKRGGRAVWSLRGRDEHVGGSSTSWRACAAKQLRG